jgi:hypothetical protein
VRKTKAIVAILTDDAEATWVTDAIEAVIEPFASRSRFPRSL